MLKQEIVCEIETHSDWVISVISFVNFYFDDVPCLLGVVCCVIPEVHAQQSLKFAHRSQSMIYKLMNVNSIQFWSIWNNSSILIPVSFTNSYAMGGCQDFIVGLIKDAPHLDNSYPSAISLVWRSPTCKCHGTKLNHFVKPMQTTKDTRIS